MKETSLYELLNEIYKKHNIWDYYGYCSRLNPIENPSRSREFIQDYFTYGYKSNVFMGNETQLECLFENHLYHTIIVFF